MPRTIRKSVENDLIHAMTRMRIRKEKKTENQQMNVMNKFLEETYVAWILQHIYTYTKLLLSANRNQMNVYVALYTCINAILCLLVTYTMELHKHILFLFIYYYYVTMIVWLIL